MRVFSILSEAAASSSLYFRMDWVRRVYFDRCFEVGVDEVDGDIDVEGGRLEVVRVVAGFQ
jgi:hypothetical protein